MTPLKKSELKEGEIYQCCISGNKSLCVQSLEHKNMILGKVYHSFHVTMKYYNQSNGLYQEILAEDNQYIKL